MCKEANDRGRFKTLCPDIVAKQKQGDLTGSDFAKWLNANGGIPEDKEKYPALCEKFVTSVQQKRVEDAILKLKKGSN